MQWVAWVLSIALAFFIGYKLNKIESTIRGLSESVSKKKDVEPMKSNDTVIIDPLDPIQQAIYERRQMMKGLNGDDYEE